jgi:hypothetical protein
MHWFLESLKTNSFFSRPVSEPENRSEPGSDSEPDPVVVDAPVNTLADIMEKASKNPRQTFIDSSDIMRLYDILVVSKIDVSSIKSRISNLRDCSKGIATEAEIELMADIDDIFRRELGLVFMLKKNLLHDRVLMQRYFLFEFNHGGLFRVFRTGSSYMYLHDHPTGQTSMSLYTEVPRHKSIDTGVDPIMFKEFIKHGFHAEAAHMLNSFRDTDAVNNYRTECYQFCQRNNYSSDIRELFV